MKIRLIGAVLLALLVFAGVAQAAGVFDHDDPAKDLVAKRVHALEQTLRNEGEATTSRLRRGPKGSRGPRGARGPQGPKGATGAVGPKGAFGSVTSPASAAISLCPFGAGACAVGGTRVECPPGTVLTGGGYIGAGILTTVTWSASIGNAWAIIAVNLDEEQSVPGLKAVAQCAGP
jgi:hypothetical protein